MASFRVVDPFQSYRDANGNSAEGGYFLFYDAGTTTPKAVYADPGLVTSNGSRIDLDAEGRIEAEAWGDGGYRVRLYQADGTLIAEADNVQAPGGNAAQIPALVNGQWLTNNGAILQWAPILQLPDPTGQDGKVVTADGAGYILTSLPTPPTPVAPDIEVTAAKFRAAQGATSFLLQNGSATAPATGLVNTSVSVVFPEEFAAAPKVFAIPSSDSNAGGPMVPELTSVSATGFTVLLTIAAGNLSNAVILNSVSIDWIALGTVATPVPAP